MRGTDLAFRLIALVINVDAIGRIAEPDRIIGFHDDVVRAVEPLALIAIRQDGDRAIMLCPADTPRLMLAGDQPTLPIDGIAVGVIRGLPEDRGLPMAFVVAHHPVVRRIRKHQKSSERKIGWSLRPLKTRGEFVDVRGRVHKRLKRSSSTVKSLKAISGRQGHS